MEKILTISEVSNVDENGVSSPESWSAYDGFCITTDKQKIFLLISNSQSCCENWGYFCSNDDFSEFIGAELKEITKTDTCLKTSKLPEYGCDEGDAMFINIETDRGTLQFTAYNAHNGYYGHDCRFISTTLNLDERL